MIYKNLRGFTLVQLIISMTLILVLTTAVFLWIDPLDRIGDAKDKKRIQDVNIFAAALFNYAKEHDGAMPVLGYISPTKKVLCSSPSGSTLTCDGETDFCLPVDDEDFFKYLRSLPYDPDKSSAADSGYYLKIDSYADANLIVGSCENHGGTAISKQLNLKSTCPGGGFGGGYCWYLAVSTNQSCDATCQALSLECVKNATYGSDVNSSGAPVCILNENLGSDCSSCVISATGTPAWGGPPSPAVACTVQQGAVICSKASGTGKYGICPCQ